MRLRASSPIALCSAVSLFIGVGIGAAFVAPLQARQTTKPGVNPQERILYGNLYIQTSAEYYAVCTQTYALATAQLRQRLASLPVDASKKPAIILDLDETVLDNGGYESYVDRESATFKPETWATWEKDFSDEVRLVPGAKAFIDAAEKSGVTVIYLSNRSKTTQAGTIAALTHVGLSTENIENRLFLQEANAPSDKTSRRKTVMDRYNVVMLLGDNLRDFSEEFAAPKLKPDDSAGQVAGIAARRATVDKNGYHWGTDWFILPNPIYGEWEKLLGDNPRQKLYVTKMPVAAKP